MVAAKARNSQPSRASAQGWRASSLSASTGTLPGSLRSASRIVLLRLAVAISRQTRATTIVDMVNTPSGTNNWTIVLSIPILLCGDAGWRLRQRASKRAAWPAPTCAPVDRSGQSPHSVPMTQAVSTIAHQIQLAVAPVFLLAGIGSILNVMAGRLARVVERARSLEREFFAFDEGTRAAATAELRLPDRRETGGEPGLRARPPAPPVGCGLGGKLF